MIEVIIPPHPPLELFDPKNDKFISLPKNETEKHVKLEHSLVSIQKWESKWHIPFLDSNRMSEEQTYDYFSCMCIDVEVNPNEFRFISEADVRRIAEYIENPMTATWFRKDDNNSLSHDVITAEIIYYQMCELNIPSEYRFWHLNQLLTLIRVCAEERKPPKKMDETTAAEYCRKINKDRKKRLGTKG